MLYVNTKGKVKKDNSFSSTPNKIISNIKQYKRTRNAMPNTSLDCKTTISSTLKKEVKVENRKDIITTNNDILNKSSDVKCLIKVEKGINIERDNRV